MSNVTTASRIHYVGSYPNGCIPAPAPVNRYPVPVQMPALPSLPMPSYPVTPIAPPRPILPPVSQYPSYPSYPTTPSYPSYPTTPTYPQYPTTPSYPSYPGYPNRGAAGFFQDLWGGVKERAYEIGQFIAHPLDANLRRPYMGRNPYAPRTGGETAGRWLVNGALIAGAVFLGRGLIARIGGGGAGVGMNSGLSGVLNVVTAPFRWAGNAIGSVVRGVGNALGGLFAGIGGGAHVGFR